jgi:hypothetical protein
MLLDLFRSCAICCEPFERTPHVDHCHKTGSFRGLLCTRCNTAIGLLRDSPDLARAAARYLDEALPELQPADTFQPKG